MIKSMYLLLLCFTSISILTTTSNALNTISLNQTITDGVSTVESADGVFELGFFSPLKSKKRYFGIWYKKISIKTIVWVANRDTPLNDTSGILRINEDGVLVLKDGTDSLVWSSNSSKTAKNPVAELLDNGNLVIRYENDNDSQNMSWQSFDHPTDNLLSGMKIGWDFEKGIDMSLTSWKSSVDPSPGKYRLSVNLDGFPQVLLWKGSILKLRFGPWDGIQFSGVSVEVPDIRFEVIAVFNAKEIYSSFEFDNSINVMRMMLTPDGDIQIIRWINQTQDWKMYFAAPRDECDRYALCGGYGNCNITNSRPGHGSCSCLKGFKPKYPEKLKLGDTSDGCVPTTQLTCGNTDDFVKYSGLKLPDTRRSWFNRSMNHEECESLCLINCSCTAYSYLDIRQGGMGCLLWFSELLDIRDYNVIGLDLYVKVAASEFASNGSSSAKRLRRALIIVILVLLTVVVLCIFIGTVCKKTKLRRKGSVSAEWRVSDMDTRSEMIKQRVGGIMDGGQELAVKRLSKDSRQGLDEFKNEVLLIAKLQHRNLVRLLGCCTEEGEMLLIYEYMPNKSLDSIIFDKELSKSLNWRQRYNIIGGIARGVLYLHQDSRLRIIHRDLKSSNILLDFEMNPRISDFGMARSFGGSGRQTNTTRVVGTFGYMSPEYALDGIFSVKSDVYSFGVIVLEIISGKKMKGFYQSDPGLNLLGRAWRLYKDGKFLELISGDIVGNCNPSEVFRVIQIGLLCVQPHPEDRPSMSSVVLMLSSETELS